MAEPYPPLLTRRKILGGAEETTSGTLPTITTAMSNTAVYEATMAPVDVFSGTKRQPHGNYIGTVAAPAGLRAGKLSFRQELRPGDQFTSLLSLAGFKTVSGVQIFNSDMSTRDTWGFKLFEDGRVKAMAGCAGTFTLTLTNGQIAMCQWDIDGVWQAMPTDATLPSQAPLTSAPWVCTSMTFTIGAAAVPMFGTCTINVGNSTAIRPDMTNAAGLLHAYVSDHQPTMSVDFEARTKAQGDAYTALLAAGTSAFQAVLTNGTATLTIEAAAAQRTNVTDADRDGIITDPSDFDLHHSSGDDDLTFTYDAGV